eukprot:1139082-Pelagomonas_calceolata.AAC.2
MDSLRVLFTDPVDYLVTPRVIASMVAGPILNVLCFSMGEVHGSQESGIRRVRVEAACMLAAPVQRMWRHGSLLYMRHSECGTLDAKACLPASNPSLRAGIGASVLLADLVYNVPANVIVDSARRALTGYDVFTSMVKSWVFGSVVATVSSCVDDECG